ncbi:MAG: hypothetical protein A2271_02245 [Candidatus Moranbacteria bacterium RIFOXYA12_FULL_35_19]|nr:MAG: hypothetical protein UR78_C0009G0007 [Candidatus Moranbacteria bacterium GW2011_GWF2_35_39]OGI32779.1 MAG: hypothetical protein A2489_02600 [Candidatus Moranbacteria bacterium RIFOXYC12_FULL_36_13]OGI33281.1 MAG: hypothetical protein A2343_01815 [Candidatus Moranbacteria bacterium RIFOXYB12_FULL_35_8]OGI36850.1 MAG: hypothetical protein A2271_02245 [Candidatus Moranbacteria bacterium RIFOXYA12_FULL_35_19]
MTRINLNQKVSSHLAFLLMIVLSCLLSWFTVSEGKKVAEDAKNSPAFDIAKRMENNNIKSLKN